MPRLYSVRSVILAALDVGLGQLRCDQLDLMTEGGKFSCPMMGSAACFQGNDRRREFLEKTDHFATGHLPSQHWPFRMVNTMQLKDAYMRGLKRESC